MARIEQQMRRSGAIEQEDTPNLATLPGTVDRTDQEPATVEPAEPGSEPATAAPLPSGPSAGGPGRSRTLRNRQKAVGVAFACVVLVATVLIVDVVVRTSRNTFGGFVEPGAVTFLDFPTEGTVTGIAVQPGQTVHAGQVLAVQQSHASLAAVVAADNATVQADASTLNQLEALAASSAAAPTAAVVVERAQQAVDAAQSHTQQVDAQSAQQLGAAQGTLLQSDRQLRAEQATALRDCAISTSPAAPHASTSAACIAARVDVTADESAVRRAQAAVTAAQSAGRSASNTADVSLKGLQSQLAGAQRSAQNAPATSVGAQIDVTEAAAARDQAQLLKDVAALNNATVVAPTSGVVVAVNGRVGGLAGPAGVRQLAIQVNTTQSAPGLSLLPTPAGSAASTGNVATEQEPLIELSGSAQLTVVAQVPEGRIAHIRASSTATVTIAAAGVRHMAAHFLQINYNPQTVGGGIVFDVMFSLDHPAPGLVRPGMSADLTIAAPPAKR